MELRDEKLNQLDIELDRAYNVYHEARRKIDIIADVRYKDIVYTSLDDPNCKKNPLVVLASRHKDLWKDPKKLLREVNCTNIVAYEIAVSRLAR